MRVSHGRFRLRQLHARSLVFVMCFALASLNGALCDDAKQVRNPRRSLLQIHPRILGCIESGNFGNSKIHRNNRGPRCIECNVGFTLDGNECTEDDGDGGGGDDGGGVVVVGGGGGDGDDDGDDGDGGGGGGGGGPGDTSRRGPAPTPEDDDDGLTTRTATPSGGDRTGGDDDGDDSGTSIPAPGGGSDDTSDGGVGGGIKLGGNDLGVGTNQRPGSGAPRNDAGSTYGSPFAANTVMSLYALGLGLLFLAARWLGKGMFKRNEAVLYQAAPSKAVSEKQLRNITKTWRLRGARRRFMDREGLDQP